jgi:hypothetical protein
VTNGVFAGDLVKNGDLNNPSDEKIADGCLDGNVFLLN